MTNRYNVFFLVFVIAFCSSTSLAEEVASPGPEAPTASTESNSEQLTLREALEIALKNNSKIEQAKERIARQRSVRIGALSEMLPEFILRATYDQTDKNLLPAFDGSTFGSDKDWGTRIELRQPIYGGGQAAAYYAQQRLSEDTAKKEFEEVLLDVIFATKQSFYSILLAKANIEVQKEATELFTEELENEKKKLAAGTVSELNVLRSEVSLANSQTPLIRAENEYQIALEELIQVLGADPSNSWREKGFAGELEYFDYNISPEDALDKARKQRPTIDRLSLLVDAAEKGVDVRWADYLPSVDLTASYGVEKSPFSDDIDETLESWRYGVEAQWKIFDSFGTTAKVNEERANLNIARSQLRQVRLDVEVQARRAYAKFLEAKSLNLASSKVVDQGRESLRLARNRFNAGAATQLDVLQTQLALTNAQTNQVQAKYDFSVAIAELDRATGNLTEKQSAPGADKSKALAKGPAFQN